MKTKPVAFIQEIEFEVVNGEITLKYLNTSKLFTFELKSKKNKLSDISIAEKLISDSMIDNFIKDIIKINTLLTKGVIEISGYLYIKYFLNNDDKDISIDSYEIALIDLLIKE